MAKAIGYKREYDDEIDNIIQSTILDKEQIEIISKIKNKLSNKAYSNVLTDIYKLFLNDISTSDIAKIYNKNIRTIQIILKEMGISRDRFEAQKIAVKKRDYVSIRKTFKKTMFNKAIKNNLMGSDIEQFARYDIQSILYDELPHYDIIIGINTITNYGEIDIPIILNKGEKYYKIALEIDGKVFHKSDTRFSKDVDKSIKIIKNGYKVFRISTKAYCDSNGEFRYINELHENLKIVSKQIKCFIEGGDNYYE